jgi:hypothetical protein
MYNVLSVIGWRGARVQPIEFIAILPMCLSSEHPIFLQGGRLDTEERRGVEVDREIQQRTYVGAMEAEAAKLNVVPVTQQTQPLRVHIAEGMNKWGDGNSNPWERLIDLLEQC